MNMATLIKMATGQTKTVPPALKSAKSVSLDTTSIKDINAKKYPKTALK